MKLRFMLALWAGKLSVIALCVLRRRGTVLPGRVALKICPDFLKCAPYPKRVIAVTGTNGKTTVTNMLHDLLTADGQRVLTNQAGANMADGLSAMLVRGLTPTGRCPYDACVYEVDELWARIVFPWIPPELVLITNLTRDSIVRNAHPGYIRDAVNAAMPKSARLVLNADNLFSAFIGTDNQRAYFGLDMLPSGTPTHESLIHDGIFCPSCGARLVWDVLHYSDVGRAHCPNCGLRSPERDYLGTNIDTENCTFELNEKGQRIRITLPNPSSFNVYNAVAAAAVLREMGYERERIADLFHGMEITESRYHRMNVGDTEIYRILSKDENAFANSRVFEYIRTLPGNKEIIYMCADTDSDLEWSENIAWIYDCDFELLNMPEMRNIVLYGSRALDYKLRLLLAGIPEERISVTDTVDEMPDQLQLFANDSIFILHGTDYYSLLHKVEKRIVERLKEKVKP